MLRSVNADKYGDPDLPDLVYYNLDIINGKTVDEGIGSNPTARFNETRDTAIIKDCSQYYFSIVRFTMNGSDKTLPMFLPRIEIGQPDPHKTVYQIGLSVDISYDFGGAIGVKQQTFHTQVNSVNSGIPIIYSPQNTNLVAPRPPLETQDLENAYYFVYTYDHWLDLVNTTYQQAWDSLNTQFRAFQTAEGVTPLVDLTTQAPRMEYNPDTSRFSLYCDTYGWGGADRRSVGGSADESFRMFFNSNMYGLFSFFPHNYLGGDLLASNGIGNGFATEILVKNKLGSNIYRPDTPSAVAVANLPSYWKVEQDFVSSATLWSPIASIVFISSLLPVQNEQTGQPVRYGSGNTLVPVGTQSAFQPIITDIALQNENANSYNSFVSYVPSAEYRLTALSNSPQEVRNVDIQVYWKSRLDGNLYPIELFNLSSIQVKIMFRRRDYAI